MQITTTIQDEVTVMAVAGSMDATTVTEFDAQWKKLLDEGTTKLVVEMSEVNYISSAGLRGVLMLAKVAKTKNVVLAFAGMRDMVADMFKLSGFLTILSTYPDKDAALAAM